jgi:hypothetical protein
MGLAINFWGRRTVCNGCGKLTRHLLVVLLLILQLLLLLLVVVVVLVLLLLRAFWSADTLKRRKITQSLQQQRWKGTGLKSRMGSLYCNGSRVQGLHISM